jgi:predicted lipoprotein
LASVLVNPFVIFKIMVLADWYKKFLFSLLMLLLSACGGSDNDEPSPVDEGKDREAILIHWADNIVKPSYADFEEKLNALAVKAESFIDAPTTPSLIEFRSAWIDAYLEWQKVELFEFGPADKYTLRNFFNIYPADVTGINANMNDAAANLALPASYARQGFPALDYLLNGVAADDAAILAYYTTDPDAAKRIAYVDKIVSRMKTLLSNVVSEWNGAYRDTFVSSTGLDIGSSMGAVVNAYVLYYERFIRSGKIGIPAGAIGTTVGTPFPEKVEAFYKRDLSLDLAKIAHQSVIDFFNGKSANGTSGPCFKSYLDALDAKDSNSGTLLSTIINNQFAAINELLNQLSDNLYEQIQSNNQAMVNVYTHMQTNVRYLKVDMSSAMSITIVYTDNDGD